MLRLSQGQLTLLDTCPRKFQHVVVEQCAALPSPEQQAGLAWGDRFHLLMQQQQLGLPVETLLVGDAALQQAVQVLLATAPDLFAASKDLPKTAAPKTSGPEYKRLSEHLRSFRLQDHSFSVVYDLLLLESNTSGRDGLCPAPQDRAQILDWKTYSQPQNDRWLAEHWQTRLYCYALAETSDYQPEQISMTYWFVTEKAQSLQIPYGPTQHAQIHQSLLQILDRLEQWLIDYRAGRAFPQVEASRGLCDRCPFAERCGRGSEQGVSEDSPQGVGGQISDWQVVDLDAIDEVTL